MTVQTLDVISVNLWGILISLINLVIMYLILKKLFFKPVKKIMADRQKEVDDVYAKAEEANRRAEDNRSYYEDKLAHAEEDAASLLRAANERARKAEEEIRAEANRKAAATLKKADEDIALETKKARNEIKSEIASLSLDIAEKVIEREISEDDHKALIDRFIEDIDSGETEG
jgi:F-type H+-transporting ATPase subunit b